MNIFRHLLVAMFLVSILASGASAGVPYVSSTTPANNATGVSVSDPIVINFSEAVKWTTVYNNGSYRITVFEDAPNTPFTALTYSPTSDSTRYTLTPTTALKFSTKYRVVVNYRIKSVYTNESMGNNSNTYTFYFTTESAPDTVPPTVTPSSPADGATNVPLNSTIVAQFSEPMTSTSVTTSSFTLNNGVSGTVVYDSTNNTATFTPSSALAGGTTYTATVTTAVTDLAGNHMAANKTWQFTTLIPDTTPPTVLSTSPVSGATSVAVTSAITIVFSESMDPSTITTGTITVAGVSGTVSYDSGTNTATFTPSSSLNYGTDYTATVSTGVKDLAGNALQASRVWTFTTGQNVTPPDVNEYCQVPPFIAGTGVQPNVLLTIDNSGSMMEFAYKTKGKGGGSGTSADSSYDPTTTYYGYFDSTQMYKYTSTSGGFFEVDSTKTLSLTSFWSGNMLNWLTMRRTDVVRKVLVGGKTTPRSANTANYLIPLENTDRDYYKAYGGVYYKIDDGPTVKVCSSSSCSSFSTTYNTKVYVGDQPPQDGLVLRYSDRIRFGIMFFNDDGSRYEDGSNSDRDGGNVAVDIGSTGTNLITQIENTDPSTWTPLAESFYEGVRYFEATTSAYNGGTYSGKDPITSSCQRNFMLILTDGEATKDQNLPGGSFNNKAGTKSNQVTDSYGFNIKTWMDAIGTNEGTTSLYSTDPGSNGSYYLAGVAYYAHNTDLRSSTVGNGAISGTQNLITYTVFAFDDSAVGRKLLQLASKYGGYDDRDGNGKPYTDSTCGTASPNAKCTEWDKNGDGVPDTYYEANQGSQLQDALTSAFNDILTRVSSGTAASILNNSEGSGASLLQAVFYPKKAFDSGTEVTWVGELQNLWYYLDPYLQLSSIRVDTVSDYKLSLLDDNIAQFYFDSSTNQTLVRLSKDVNGTGTTTVDLGTYSPDDATNVKSLWRAGKLLWSRDLTSDNRTIYTHTGLAAYDTVVNSGGDATGLASFSSALKNDLSVQSYLRAANATEANKLISYIRGSDQSGYRTRAATIAGAAGTWRLGDIISSTPKIEGNVGLNSYHQDIPTGYTDSSYSQFIKSNDYTNRGMAYVGANDGMLHAFRMGVLQELTDPCRQSGANQATCAADKSQINDYTVVTSGANQGANANIRADAADNIGREEWAYVPRQALPYLKFLSDADYPHLFYVDGTPLIVDVAVNKHTECASAGTANYWDCAKQTRYTTVSGVQTKNLDVANTSWKTVLIGSTGLGGASRNRGGAGACYGAGSDCVKTPMADLGYSSYFALDVTNPKEPKYMWEFHGDPTAGATAALKGGNLGFATTGPVIVRVGGATKNGRWFAVFASGPTGTIDATNHQFLGRSDQPLRLFIVDVATGALVKTIDTGIANAFAGSVSNGAIDNDRSFPNKSGFYQDDAAYIGYVQKTDSTHWTSGGVIRLVTNESIDPNDASKPWTWSSVISGVGPVTTAVTKLQDRGNGKLWLYFGTGRYFYKNATEIDDEDNGRRIYGIQEPCYDAAAVKISPTCTTSLSTAQLLDQTTTPTSTLASTYKGWYINLDTSALNDGYASERVITDPVASTNGVVFFTTFRPTGDVCGYGGNSYIWAVNYATGSTPATNAMKGKLMVQVSTGAFAEVSMSSGFTAKDNRRSTSAIQGVPPKAQGLSLLTNPKPVKKIIHIQEK
ncbi:Ig-like domain-containing protein [Geobacter sp. AOG2]|uniref:Ig-like domain-containing protein n=1 Tax=Geobacter sp. AOG2 TaxID=1566347 RepID=UPI001CC49CC8|nr:Ig-like domain-containing protein [Geobacter sp. AOG2]GFE61361.1 hypothetical protein AOG2_19480 [Geobacter sp. AOG2]